MGEIRVLLIERITSINQSINHSINQYVTLNRSHVSTVDVYLLVMHLLIILTHIEKCEYTFYHHYRLQAAT